MLMIHNASCPRNCGEVADSHVLLDHHPLKASYHHQQPSYAVINSNNNNSESLFDPSCSNGEGLLNAPDEYLNYDNEDDHYHHPKQVQFSTTVLKVQSKMNNLINKHKASLKLYDDIVNLFNDYILSPYFDIHAKLNSRKSFILSMESSNCNIRNLHPRYNEVRLHDGTQVTAPVFDTAMILDLVTNPDLMNPDNNAEGYNLFTKDVDPNNNSNHKYGEAHNFHYVLCHTPWLSIMASLPRYSLDYFLLIIRWAWGIHTIVSCCGA
jgi:hypothetical protein